MGLYRSLSTLPRRFFAYRDERAEAKRLEGAGLGRVSEIPTDLERRELVNLYELAAACPPGATVLEIGSYLGASSCCLAAGLAQGGGQLYCVDTWQNETMIEGPRDTYDDFLENTRDFDHVITPVRKMSTELTREDVVSPLHLVFLDGDHSYEAVRHDFLLVSSWLTEDGVIVFHDFAAVHFEGVTRVVGEALATGEWIMAGFLESTVWIRPARWSPPPWLDDTRSQVGTGADR